jgi:hypothetical protein
MSSRFWTRRGREREYLRAMEETQTPTAGEFERAAWEEKRRDA